MQLWERKRVGTIIRRIYEQYSPSLSRGGRKPIIKAKDILSKIPGSSVTIWKARKALGIQCKMIAGRHCWLAPKRTLDEALDLVKAKHKKPGNPEQDAKVVADFLKDLFVISGYDVTAARGREHLQQVHIYKRNRNLSAGKKLLQIKTVHPKISLDGQWHWVWGGPEIQEWLIEQLSTEDKPEELLMKLSSSKGWSWLAVLDACRKVGGIQKSKIKGKRIWHDINCHVISSVDTPVELPDTPGSVITSVESDIYSGSNEDWMPSSRIERREHWARLKKWSIQGERQKETYERYIQQMKTHFYPEYHMLIGSSVRKEPTRQRIAALEKLVQELQERLNEK